MDRLICRFPPAEIQGINWKHLKVVVGRTSTSFFFFPVFWSFILLLRDLGTIHCEHKTACSNTQTRTPYSLKCTIVYSTFWNHTPTLYKQLERSGWVALWPSLKSPNLSELQAIHLWIFYFMEFLRSKNKVNHLHRQAYILWFPLFP